MFKHILLLVGLSVAAVFLQDQLAHVFNFLMSVHAQIANVLGRIFSLNSVGEVVQSVLALLLIPIVIGALIAIAHFFIKQEHFPHTLNVIWVCWAILLAAIVSQTGHVTNQSAQQIQNARQLVQDTKAMEAQKAAEAAAQAAKAEKHHW